MAIVEDEVRNESEEENEIEVVVEEDDADQDSDDSDDEDDEEVLERKVAELETRIAEDPYNYDDHIELIQALWGLSELDRWRTAFDRLQKMFVVKDVHWLLRIQTEETLAHSPEAKEQLVELFRQASLDCYYIPILTEWCSWSLGAGAETARTHIEEVLRLAGPDPLSGKLFWDAKRELEKAQLEAMSADDPDYKQQRERTLFCLEEIVSRPLLNGEEAWPQFQELAAALHGETYVDKVKKQHDAATEYLQKITPYEDKLLTMENPEEKCKVYEEYIDKVKELSQEEKYADCDSNGILKVLYDRATSECVSCDGANNLLLAWARHSTRLSSRATQARVLAACARRRPHRATFWLLSMQQAEREGKGVDEFEGQLYPSRIGLLVYNLLLAWARHSTRLSSRATQARVLAACARRRPHRATFWLLSMQQAEREGKGVDEVKAIFETALSKGMESYKQTESLWLGYLECLRRATAFDNEPDVERLRRTFRLAWDSLAEAWGEEANDCEVPLYWARLEYKRMKDPKQGKEIFDEIFNYGENKTMSKYWEAFINLESHREPSLSENKLRELHRRALKFVTDYPPAAARLWTDYERDYGQLSTAAECQHLCEAKLKEWRDSYQAMKEKMTNQKKGKQTQNNKKGKFDKKKKEDDKPKKGKRKSDEAAQETEVKRKKDSSMEVDEKVKDGESGASKRSHEDDGSSESTENKRHRAESPKTGPRVVGNEACTLFVSNLDYNVNEKNLREKLSEYGTVVSLRVRAGVKAFGGSICYCQYSTSEAVDEAIKHDRTPLDGRPMFLSRYSASKTKGQFKYATTVEKNKLFVRNLPFSHCTRERLTEIFDKYGKLSDVRVVTFKDGKPKGLAYVDYEDEKSAAEAVEKTNGLLVADRNIEVAVSAPPPRGDSAPALLGQPKRDSGGGMRRTQLSSFIPSVLQKASTSAATTSNGSHGSEKRPLSNSDFRSLLLKK